MESFVREAGSALSFSSPFEPFPPFAERSRFLTAFADETSFTSN
jgi:hypothetical protein